MRVFLGNVLNRVFLGERAQLKASLSMSNYVLLDTRDSSYNCNKPTIEMFPR